MRKSQLSILVAVVAFVAGCSDGRIPVPTLVSQSPPPPVLPPPPPPPPPVIPEDVSGAWFNRIEKNAVNCGQGETVDAQAMVIAQNDADITMKVSNGVEYTGTVNGDIVEWLGDYPERGGTAHFTSAKLVVSAGSGAGDAAWTWSNGTDSCNGTMAISMARDKAVPDGYANSRPDIADPVTFTDNVAYIDGSIGVGQDVFDYFKVIPDADGVLQAELSHFDTAATDLDLLLFDAALNVVASSSTPDQFEMLQAPLLGGSVYYVKVESETLSGPDRYYLSLDLN